MAHLLDDGGHADDLEKEMQTQQAEEAGAPLAYDIEDASRKVGLGRSKMFEEISAGRLKARKAGRRTLILHADLVAWAASLPVRAIDARRHAA